MNIVNITTELQKRWSSVLGWRSRSGPAEPSADSRKAERRPKVPQRARWTITFQWTTAQLQYMLARVRGGESEVVAAATVCLDDGNSQEQLAKHLAEALTAHKVKRATARVALSRTHVEFVPLQLPQASDEELPSLVEFQIGQQFTDVAHDALVDFVPLATDLPNERQVLACLLRPQTAEYLRGVCQDTKLEIKAVTVRPLATASLLAADISSHRTTVLIAPHQEEADAVVLRGGRMALARTIRLPAAPPATRARDLLQELQRSLLLVPVDYLQDGYDLCVVSDETAESQEFSRWLGEHSGDAVATWDPVESAVRHGVTLHLPDHLEHAATYAPLLGLFLAEPDPAIRLDFWNPRRPPPAPQRWKKWTAYAAAATVLLGLGGWFLQQEKSQRFTEIAALSQQLASTTKNVDKLSVKHNAVLAIKQWQADDIAWLDELRDFANRFPPADEAFIQRISISTNGRDTGIVNLQIRVRDPEQLAVMEANLRDAYHSVQSKRVAEQDRSDGFRWQFESSIQVRPRGKDAYLQQFQAESGDITQP